MRRCVWSRNIKNGCSIYIYDISSIRDNDLTLILLTWRKWWTPNNASKRQMRFNSAFKGLIYIAGLQCSERHLEYSSFRLLHSLAMVRVKRGVMHSDLRIMAFTFYYAQLKFSFGVTLMPCITRLGRWPQFPFHLLQQFSPFQQWGKYAVPGCKQFRPTMKVWCQQASNIEIITSVATTWKRKCEYLKLIP